MGIVKRIVSAAIMSVALATPLLVPAPAQAWWAHPGWHAGWGWHTGWGWRGGVYIGAPAVVGPVVVGPAYAPAPYRWIPGHYTRWGAWVAPHWGYY